MSLLRKRVDYDLICIGAGSAGLVSAYLGSAMKAKVALIEKSKMGGDCLNTGCVPSKTFIQIAKICSLNGKAQDLGLKSIKVEVDFPQVMQKVREVIETIAPNDSVERYQKLGVNCIQGSAKLLSPKEVVVNSTVLRTNSIILSTGARPNLPAIPGLDKVQPLTSDTVWNLNVLPRKLLVLGGGVIGCELAQAFQRLGSQVTLVERNERLLPREDSIVSELIEKKFVEEGIELVLSKQIHSFEINQDGKKEAICEGGKRISFDEVFVALGRKPNVESLGLKELGIEQRSDGSIKVNSRMRTNVSGVYACGDVVGIQQFTHFASLSATTAALNALLFGRASRLDMRVFPAVTFTDPEVARVGLSENEANALNISYEKVVLPMERVDRSVLEGKTEGFYQLLTAKGSDRILGATIVAPNAGEFISEVALAMKYSLGIKKILNLVHAYPTVSEVHRMAAGDWQRSHVPNWSLQVLKKLFEFRRKMGI